MTAGGRPGAEPAPRRLTAAGDSSATAIGARGGGPRPPPLLVAVGVVVATAMLLPLVYLVLRVGGSVDGLLPALLRPRLGELLLRTVGFALAVTTGGLLLGVPLAWLTTRTDLPLRRIWSIALALPLVIPSYVGAYIFVAALGPRGLLQQVLAGPFGVERLPELYGFGGATLVLVAFTYPYVYLSVRSALVRSDPALEEAARSLGRGGWAVFRDVVLPQLRPAMTAGALLVALYALSDFGAVALLRFDTFTRAIYVQYQASFDRAVAAGLALMLALLTGFVLVAEVRLRGRARYHRSTTGVARAARPVSLGPWRWPAVTLCAGVTLGALVLPVGVLMYWLAASVTQGVRTAVLVEAIVGSVQASALTAVAAVVLALPLTVLAVRFPSRFSTTLERLTYLGYALPGIVTALALVFFGANYAPFLYQTLAMLVFAYLVRFLPQAVGAVRASLLQVGPHLEEAARGMGRSPLRAWLEVTLPLIRPGVLAGAALVFLTAMKELPATLLLSPIGYRTLAVTTWAAASDGLFAEAAVPSLLLILVSVPPLVALLRDRAEPAP